MLQGNFSLEGVKMFFVDKFRNISAETLGWIAVIVLHAATIPSLPIQAA